MVNSYLVLFLSYNRTAGAYYLYKNYIKEDASDDFDDFEDDYEDFDTELEEEDDKVNETREYVSINITTDEKKKF